MSVLLYFLWHYSNSILSNKMRRRIQNSKFEFTHPHCFMIKRATNGRNENLTSWRTGASIMAQTNLVFQQ